MREWTGGGSGFCPTVTTRDTRRDGTVDGLRRPRPTRAIGTSIPDYIDRNS
jgi:hypothetical protein